MWRKMYDQKVVSAYPLHNRHEFNPNEQFYYFYIAKNIYYVYEKQTYLKRHIPKCFLSHFTSHHIHHYFRERFPLHDGRIRVMT